MTHYGADVQGGASTTPLTNYLTAVSEHFPQTNRTRIIESSIASRSKLDILPVNLDGNPSNNAGISDSYIEFRVPGVPGQFLDLSTLSLELRVGVTKLDRSQLTEGDHVIFTNGLSNTMFKSCACYFNEQMVESNALFNYHAFLKMISTIPQDKIDSMGRAAFFRRDYEDSKGIVSRYDEDYFTGSSKAEKTMIKDLKEHGLSMAAPLLSDISSLDAYLLDSVDVRVRLELANKSWILNSHQDASAFRFKLEMAKLWVDRVVPHSPALESLNQALSLKPLQYTYNRTLYKTYVLGSNQTSLVAELPFNQILPENLTMIVVDMDSIQGVMDKNGLYFQHADMSHIQITINGMTAYNINSTFPHHSAKLYYTTLEALGLEKHNSLTFEAFNKGRTVTHFNFVTEDVQNGIPLEKSGNLRINLTFAKGHNQNRVVMFFADTTGIIEIDNYRHVRCIVRA